MQGQSYLEGWRGHGTLDFLKYFTHFILKILNYTLQFKVIGLENYAPPNIINSVFPYVVSFSMLPNSLSPPSFS
jgi:hypothetical protein